MMIRHRAVALAALVWVCAPAGVAASFDASLDPNPFFKTPTALWEFVAKTTNFGELGKECDEIDLRNLQFKLGPNGTFRVGWGKRNCPYETGPGNPDEEFLTNVFADYSCGRSEIVGGSGQFAGVTLCHLTDEDWACYGAPKGNRQDLERAAVVARFLVQQRLPGFLSDEHEKVLYEYKHEGKTDAAEAAQRLVDAKPWLAVSITAANVAVYNDFGFVLTEGRKFQQAVPVLEAVTKAVPDRAVAYLNLGDAYVGTDDLPRARAAFTRYQQLTLAANHAAKLPKRIQKYLLRP